MSKISNFALGATAAVALLVGAVAPASAEGIEGLYLGAGLGANLLRSSTVEGGAISAKSEYDRGWAGLLSLGHGYGNGFRSELEFSYRKNSVDKVRGSSAGGDAKSTSLMLNGLYDFDTGSNWVPTLGLGIGAARVRDSGIGNLTAAGDSVSGSDTRPAYQGIVGLGYKLSDQLTLGLDYRYFASLTPEFRTAAGVSVDNDYKSHTVLLGLRYAFNPPKKPMMPAAAPMPAPAPAPVVAAAPPPAPAPAPAPTPAPAPRNFLVFFDFDKSDITIAADSVIKQAADAFKRGQAARIELSGHTDLSGASPYNQRLSLRRAEAVKARLMQEGVGADKVTMEAHGKSRPLLPTPDGAREPQNRRVEIVIR